MNKLEIIVNSECLSAIQKSVLCQEDCSVFHTVLQILLLVNVNKLFVPSNFVIWSIHNIISFH